MHHFLPTHLTSTQLMPIVVSLRLKLPLTSLVGARAKEMTSLLFDSLQLTLA